MAHLDLDTSQGGSPSWKPLPVLVTTPLALFGDSLPAAWLVVARAGGLFGMVLGVALAVQLTGDRRRVVTITAAAVAAVALLVSPGWLRSVLHGYSEPLLLGLVAGAVMAHLAGRRTLPLVLLALTGLGRPELWAVIGIYALWAWRSEALTLRRIVVVLLPLPILWFGGDFWGSGDPVHGSGEAASNADIRKVGVGDMMAEIWSGAMPIVPALALLGLALRPRDRTLQVLVGGCFGFVGYLCLLELIGYPVSARFFEPPAGMLCVLAGVGVGCHPPGAAGAQAPRSRRRRGGRGARARGLRAAGHRRNVLSGPRPGGAAERPARRRVRLRQPSAWAAVATRSSAPTCTGTRAPWPSPWASTSRTCAGSCLGRRSTASTPSRW